MSAISEASWYVVDAHNKVIVKCEYAPDTKDLQTRNETAIFSKEDILLQEAEYVKGEIKKHVNESSRETTAASDTLPTSINHTHP